MMSKLKSLNKNSLDQFTIKSLKGQQLSENEVYAINAGNVPGLLHIDVVQKGSSFKLIYNTDGMVSLKVFLNNPLNKQMFARLLQNILANLKAVESAYFNRQYLLMDIDHTFICPSEMQIYFTYVPIQLYESGTSLKEFLLDIIQYGTFAPGEDNGYVRNYITILNSGINFSVFDLEEYINNLLGQNAVRIQEIECPKCNAKVKRGTKYCHICGTRISGNTGDINNGVYDPLADSCNGTAEEAVEDEKQFIKIGTEGQKDTQGLSDGTTVLGANGSGTMSIGQMEIESPPPAYLVRLKSNEKILLDKASFRIGTEKNGVDYWVGDNKTVSRNHADILRKNEQFFIIDLNSTNKTYVNGKVIQPGMKIELLEGTKIRLSNESFVFHIGQ